MTDDLRVGDAERDAVMADLREHFAQGRLTHEELGERLDAALAARTAGELRRVTADLPGAPAPPGGPRAGGRTPPPGPVWQGPVWQGPHPFQVGPRPFPVRPGPRRPSPVAAFVLAAALLAAVVTGSPVPVFVLLKLAFLAWIVTAVLGRVRHRHHGPRHPRRRHLQHGHRHRTGTEPALTRADAR
ncbi:hypothetical protein Sru01_14140 [Sphaerisporangium rufum]|uniref:DUF1707 domain-containing protein n=1 Tax=Sphaerisporangium rufum TaxID=1381558 RepID=A0A919R3M5_9ACTN|nr:DUF1707 domain-containing protein [Sphaerisporangium rufum]GII76432.1 hypothetical protein Sru01_14140 [Sphaerisporangium rufum]